jgi:hypothetical protein
MYKQTQTTNAKNKIKMLITGSQLLFDSNSITSIKRSFVLLLLLTLVQFLLFPPPKVKVRVMFQLHSSPLPVSVAIVIMSENVYS